MDVLTEMKMLIFGCKKWLYSKQNVLQRNIIIWCENVIPQFI